MSWKPTRKWWAATLTGAGAVAVMLLTGDRGHVDDPEIVALVGLIVQRGVAFFVPNEDTPGGVPTV
jgi:hypothetical protein